MNAAFYRGEAISHLESLATVLVTHLALVCWFPQTITVKHWQRELRAFSKALSRYNTSKMKRKNNFNKKLIIDALYDTFDTADKKDNILLLVESHGMTLPAQADWRTLQQAVGNFALEIVTTKK